MNPEFLARIVKVFFAKSFRKNPQRALGQAIKYWEKMNDFDDFCEEFSVPESLKDRIENRARRLDMSPEDYLKMLVSADLERGPEIPLAPDWRGPMRD